MQIFRKYFWLCGLIILASCFKNKQVRIIPIEDFFKNPEKTAFAISPDGKYISYLRSYKNRLNIFVQTLEGGNITRLQTDTTRDISYYFWASNSQILYVSSKNGGIEGPKLYAAKRDGTHTRELAYFKKTWLRLITEKRAINDEILVALNKRDSTVFDAYRLNIQTNQLTLIGINPGNVTEWFADPEGKLRMASASDGVNETLLYRSKESDLFRPIITNNFKTTVIPLGFCKNYTCIYALSNQNRDKTALVKLDCVTGKEHHVIYNNQKVDIIEGMYSNAKHQLVYATYETWKQQRYYLDNDIKGMYTRLEKMLPNTEISITDQDSAEQKFIIKTYTDRNPGTFYLYTITNNKLIKLGDINPSINKEEMAEMKAVKYKTRDGLEVNGYLTLPIGKADKNLPIIVMPHGGHGGPSSRNSWMYNAEVQFLANRGYGVFQMNYRGSTGYGKVFWAAGFKEWGGKIQNDIADGVHWLINEGIADPKRIAIYGSGFGGYSALHGLCFNSDLYKCGASYSGLINLFTYLKGVPAYHKAFQAMSFEMVGNPETDADYFRLASPIFHTDRIKAPVLIAQGAGDPSVNVNETNQFVKELKKRNIPVTYILKEDEGHFFKKEENKWEFYKQLEFFLKSNLNKK